MLKNAQYSSVWNAVIYQFNLHKIKILDQRKELAEKRVDIIKDLYLSQKVNQEELLKHLESLAEVRSLLETYQSFNSKLDETHHFKNIRLIELPIIDLDYEVLKSKIQGVENDSIAFYKKENIDLQNKLIDDISLQTYVRYSYYDLVKTNPGHRDFMSVGLSLGVPLKFGHQVKRKRMALEKESLTYLPPEDRINLEKEVLTNYYEFRYKLKQISNQQFKKLGYIELLRQENARKEIDTLSFNPVSSLRLLDDLMKVDLELIDLKQQSYLKLLQINASLPYTDLEELFTVKQLNEDAFKITTNYQSVYIWSNIFKDYDLNFIINYIRKKSFKEIILAIGQNDPYLSQKKELINQMHQQEIDVQLMLSRNKLINENISDYLNTHTKHYDLSKIKSIHLDIEPHLFNDWKDKQNTYLEAYMLMLKKAKEFTNKNSLKLAISIPLYYPQDYVNNMYNIADQVFFMAYENTKTSYIVRKLKDYPQNKSVIALRFEDFEDMIQLNQKIIDLKAELKPAYFILHDLQRMIEFNNN